MQRIVIDVPLSTPGNNLGTPVQLTVGGRITAVQFNIYAADGAATGLMQLSASPVLVSPIQQSGLNPQEIASAGFTYAAPTSAFVGASGTAQLLPCDYPVTVGEQLFVNGTWTSGTSVAARLVIFLA